MRYIKFLDSCTIKRATEGADEWDNVTYTEVYKGECHFVDSAYSNQATDTRIGTVYLPTADADIHKNDTLEVVDAKGQKRKGVVNFVRYTQLPLSGKSFTRIEIVKSYKG